jgi:PAS domain S-box-containing protein
MATRDASQVATSEWPDGHVGGHPFEQETQAAEIQRLRERLHVTEARLEMAMSAGGLAMWDWNVVTGDVCYNDQWQYLLDISADDLLLRQSLSERLALPDSHSAVMRELERYVSNETPCFQQEFELPTASGGVKWILARAHAVKRNASGQALRVIGAWRDITLRRENTKSVEEAQRRWERAVAGTSDGLFDWDLSTGYVWYAPRFRELLGYGDNEFQNSFNSFQRTLHPDDRIDVMARVRNHLEQRAPLDIQCRLATRSGEYRWFRLRAQAEREVGGRPRRLSGSIRDIHGLINATEALNRSNDYYGTILDALPVSVGYIDSTEHIVYVNRAGCALLGREDADIRGQHLSDVVAPAIYQQLAANFHMVLSGQTIECQLRISGDNGGGNGQPLDINVTYIPHRAQDSDQHGCFLLARNITAQLQLEAELRQSQKMEAIGHLTGGVAHDFNNLLSVVIGNAQLLTRTLKDSPRLLKQADTVLRAALRGAELTRRLLTFARQHAEQTQAVQLGNLLHGMLDLLRRTLPGDVELKLVEEQVTGAAEIDPGQFENAILNLVINARDAMPNGGQIQITSRAMYFNVASQTFSTNERQRDAHATIPFIEVSVTDTGSGMSPDTRLRAFEPFFTTKEAGKGSGLGLAMVYSFVKRSNGEIRIDSAMGKGTCIRMYLPQSARCATTPEQNNPSIVEFPHGHETILVVDNNHDVRTTAVEMLQSLGYRVLSAANGHEALQLAHNEPKLDLLFSDITLPGISADSLMLQLRAERPQLPVLLTNTVGDLITHDITDCAATNSMLSKPFQLNELAKRVRAALDQTSNPAIIAAAEHAENTHD